MSAWYLIILSNWVEYLQRRRVPIEKKREANKSGMKLSLR